MTQMTHKGIGFFLNSSDTKVVSSTGTSLRETVELLKQSKAAWGALWIESPDQRRPELKDLQKAALNLQASGVSPVLWTFPDADHLKDTSEWIGRCYDALCKVQGTGLAAIIPNGELLVILDIEVDFKGKAAKAKEFVALLKALKASRPGLVFGFTSYPFGHPTLPWKAFAELLEPGKSPVMPQLYTSGGSAKTIGKSWAHYTAKFPGCEVVPVAASYIEDSRRLKTSLDLLATQKPKGVCVWVLKTTDAQEAKVLAEFAKAHFGA